MKGEKKSRIRDRWLVYLTTHRSIGTLPVAEKGAFEIPIPQLGDPDPRSLCRRASGPENKKNAVRMSLLNAGAVLG
jgi:hypothetical protein